MIYSPITDGLVFSMQGGTTFDSAKNNVITNVGATPTTDHNGRAGRGWQALNNSASITLPDNILDSFYGMSGKGSIVMAFQHKNESRVRALNTKYTASGTLRETTILINTSNNFRCFFYTNNTASTNYLSLGVDSLIDNAWYMIVINYDFSLSGVEKLKLYVNGVFSTNSSQAGTFGGLTKSTSPNTLLNASFNNTYYYDKPFVLYEIYNRTLSPNEIQYHYNWWLSH